MKQTFRVELQKNYEAVIEAETEEVAIKIALAKAKENDRYEDYEVESIEILNDDEYDY